MSKLHRRRLLKLAAITPLVGFSQAVEAIEIPESKPFLDLESRFAEPVIIEAIEQIPHKGKIWFRVQSNRGATGFCPGNDRLKVTMEMARQLVIPYFIGQDARQIERLVDGVYTDRDSRGSVYKFAGMPFWNIVGHLEVAIFDLLGKIAECPLSELIGTPRRSQIPVYISQFGRTTTAAEEVENAVRDLEKTGARATKLKVGKRMSNSPEQSRRDRKMIELARKMMGEEIAIYVDANSSYTEAEAIEMGQFLDDHGVALFEEPLPWQDIRGTANVTAALADRKIQVAGGEQDSNLWLWRDMIDQQHVDIVQPDVFYNGGLVRTLRVARMAQRAGIPVTPHSPKVLPDAAANLQLCSVLSNPGPFQEYRSYGTVIDGKVAVPSEPGLGIDLDPQLRELDR